MGLPSRERPLKEPCVRVTQHTAQPSINSLLQFSMMLPDCVSTIEPSDYREYLV